MLCYVSYGVRHQGVLTFKMSTARDAYRRACKLQEAAIDHDDDEVEHGQFDVIFFA